MGDRIDGEGVGVHEIVKVVDRHSGVYALKPEGSAVVARCWTKVKKNTKLVNEL